MKIAIVGYGLPFGPDTLTRTGLGGSETAQLCIGKELAKLGLEVHQFIRLERGVQARACAHDGVFYHSIEAGAPPRSETFDHVIVCRMPQLWNSAPWGQRYHLWIHDFANEQFPPRGGLSNFHEIWAISAWQRQNWITTLGLPESLFWLTRNGIPRVKTAPVERNMRQLVFASRPERGLWALVRDGGIMAQLEDYMLLVCGYDDRPAQHKPFYDALDQFIARRPNVKVLGPLASKDLRQLIAGSGAYVMPTNYPETSCILARECMEQATPMIVTPGEMSGALPETLAECAVFGSTGQAWDTLEFIKAFAETTRTLTNTPDRYADVQARMRARGDLYYDDVAKTWMEHLRASSR